ncbi:MAG: hypothetical protein K5924_02800 [Chloroflexi bacterium]|nr:hypothetical protein [Chloroflexota bacterium]
MATSGVSRPVPLPAALVVFGLLLMLTVVACSGPSIEPAGSHPAAVASDAPYAPDIDPANFTTTIDNPYFPLVPGTRWVLNGTGGTSNEVTVLEVLDETRTVMGVECVVVRDIVTRDGQPIEITDDWFAQDVDGNVWYFGEDTGEYADGEVVSTAGAWEAGVDGAQPGILMPGDPTIGAAYRQEYYAGEAEDMGKVVELGASVTTPLGSWDDVLVTEDWTPLSPGITERKYYARGIGLVKEHHVGGDTGFEIVEHTES